MPSALVGLQGALLDAFFEREQRWFLTGGAALAGFYESPRPTEDLDFFALPGPDMEDGVRSLAAAAAACGARLEARKTFPDFRSFLASRGEETCLVDLVIDRAPALEPQKLRVGSVNIDSRREIAANKVCALLGRSEVKDLIDLRFLLGTGISLEQALSDARVKDGGSDPATLAWVLEQISISPDARLPSGADAVELDLFRKELVARLQRLAFNTTQGGN